MKTSFLFDKTLENTLNETVFDRPRQNALLATLLLQNHLRADSAEPFIVTLFGPANSGKKYLALALAAVMGRESLVLDLRRFSSPEILLSEEGAVVAMLKKHPDAVIVFEGLDKTDEAMQTGLLTLLSEPAFGALLSDALLFITAQSGEALYRDADFLDRFYDQPLHGQGIFMENLAAGSVSIAAATLSFLALHPVILLNPLKLETLFLIARQTLESLRAPLKKSSGIELSFSHPYETAALITLFFAPWLNALRLKKQLPGYFLDTLGNALKEQGKLPKSVRVEIGAKAQKLLNQCLKKPADWAWRLTRGNETVHLEWQTEHKKSGLVLTLKSAQITPRALLPVWQGALKISHPAAGFDTIPGQKSAKRGLGEVLLLLKEPKRLAKFGTSAPKGLLLFGPEGVGKAALARAFAAEAGWPCLEASGAALFDEAFLEQLYEKAAAYAPSVVLLEGLDAKGVVQGLVTTVPAEWLTKRIDQSAKGVFTLATAEEIDEVPEVLRQANRLELSLEVPELDHEARKAFLSRLTTYPHEPDINLDRLARMAGGLNGRDLEKIARACAFEAAKQGEHLLTQRILVEQINTLKYGHKLEGGTVKNYEHEMEMTAWHEAGHAVLSALLRPESAIEQVTIAPRSGALGFVAYEIEEKISNITKQEATTTLCVLMGGRLAQKKAFGENALDSGAVGDLESATRLAWVAVSTLGLDEEFGTMSLGSLARDLGFMPYAARIEERVKLWLQRAEEEASLLLEEHWTLVTLLAEKLIAQGVIEGEALGKLLKTVKPSATPRNLRKKDGSENRSS